MAEVIPGFVTRFDIPDLLKCMAPRCVLLVSATEDKYSKDADVMVNMARQAFSALHAEERLEHARYEGGHPLTRERFDHIVDWLATCAKAEL